MKVNENDISDVIECWQKRFDKKFVESKKSRIEELGMSLASMKEERMKQQAEINRLQFESVIGESFIARKQSRGKNKRKTRRSQRLRG